MDVAAELAALAAKAATGRVDVTTSRTSALILLRDGCVCTVEQPTVRPALGMRLVSGGHLSLANLGAALSMQEQHPDMRLGDVLVRMGLVGRPEVESVAWEQLCDDVATILSWPDPVVGFSAQPVDRLTPPGPPVDEVLSAAAQRSRTWQQIVRQIGGPDAVPSLCDEVLTAKDVALRPTEWAVLCRVDGHRSLRSIADQAGFTTLEAASVLQGLLAAGLVSVPATHLPAPEERPPPWPPAHPAAPPVRAPAASPHVTPAVRRPDPAPAPVDQFDDPADLLRELSQLGGLETGTRRRSGR